MRLAVQGVLLASDVLARAGLARPAGTARIALWFSVAGDGLDPKEGQQKVIELMGKLDGLP
jgi:hypothetical protein